MATRSERQNLRVRNTMAFHVHKYMLHRYLLAGLFAVVGRRTHVMHLLVSVLGRR